MSKDMRSTIFLFLGVLWLAAGFAILVVYQDFGLALACIAMANCNRLESKWSDKNAK